MPLAPPARIVALTLGWSCALTCRAAEPGVPHDLHEPHPVPFEGAGDVRSLAVDRNDDVWAATRAGVFRLPRGTSTWIREAGDSAAAPAFSMAAAPDGGVWVGAWNGLHRAYRARATRVPGVDMPISSVGVEPDGTVLAGGPGGFFLVPNGGQARNVPIEASRQLGRIVRGIDGHWWIATGMGAFDWRQDTGTGDYLRGDPDQHSVAVRDMAIDTAGNLWLATLGGLQRFRHHRVREVVTPAGGLPSADVRAVQVASEGTIWVGTTHGLARKNPAGWSVFAGRRWLLDDNVRDLAFDADGTAWIATGRGVSALRRTNMTLSAKATHFHRILEARHVRPPGIVEKCQLRKPGDVTSWAPMDDDNDGGYTALALAMESYRFAATGDPAARDAARRAFATGEFLQRVTDTPGFLARTVVPVCWTDVHDPNEEISEPVWAERRVEDPRDKRVPVRWRASADGRWLWKGDTSSDEITAQLFGCLVFHEHAADAAERLRVREHVCRIVDHIVDHGFVLQDLDGRHTRWGVWSPERLNADPDWAMERGINSVEILSFLKLAGHVSGNAKYETAYRRLIDVHRYDRNVLEAPNLNPAWRTYIDMELLALAYPALLAFERDPHLLGAYRASLERWHDAVKRDGNPFFEFLYATLARPGRANLDGARRFLRETPLDLVRWDVDNTRREDVGLRRWPEVEKRQTQRLLPPGEIGYSRSDQNPWLAAQGDGGRSESDGVFWLLPYWMGRHHGLVPGP